MRGAIPTIDCGCHSDSERMVLTHRCCPMFRLLDATSTAYWLTDCVTDDLSKTQWSHVSAAGSCCAGFMPLDLWPALLFLNLPPRKYYVWLGHQVSFRTSTRRTLKIMTTQLCAGYRPKSVFLIKIDMINAYGLLTTLYNTYCQIVSSKKLVTVVGKLIRDVNKTKSAVINEEMISRNWSKQFSVLRRRKLVVFFSSCWSTNSCLYLN